MGTISLNGEYFAILSASNRYSTLQTVQGLAGDVSIYLFDLNRNEWTKIFNANTPLKNIVQNINCVKFDSDNNLLFASWNKLYKINISTKEIDFILEIDEENLLNFSIDPSGKFITLHYEDAWDLDDRGIKLFSLEDSSFIMKTKIDESIPELGNWAPNGGGFCYVNDELFIFHLETKTKNKIVINKSDIKYKPYMCSFLNNKEMLLFCSYKKNKNEKYESLYDIFKLNLANGKLEKITNDGKFKSYLFSNSLNN